ncbi:MAG: type III-A CRISPR-associated RAMP protein Csm3 [Promethearchaeia archaeon]
MSNNKGKLEKRLILEGVIELLTGMHIGGTKDNLQIGGLDSPVIRDPFTNNPYIPGSTIKGKLRSLMEWKEGKASEEPCKCGLSNCKVCRIFGTSADKKDFGPTRLIVRDCFPTDKTIQKWQEKIKIGITEIKTENTINRLTSKANPRSFERVVKGSEFAFQLIYSIYSIKGDPGIDKDNFNDLIITLKMLEDDGIGGSISRGYGQIRFKQLKLTIKTLDAYENPSNISQQKFNDLEALLQGIESGNLIN